MTMVLLDAIGKDIIQSHLIDKLSLMDLLASKSLLFSFSCPIERVIGNRVLKIQSKNDYLAFLENQNLLRLHLTALSIKHCSLAKSILLELISIPSKLESIEFDNVDSLDDEIVEFLCRHHSIKRLAINKCPLLTNKSLYFIGRHLGESLCYLRISRTMITASGLEYISFNKKLEKLDISESYLLEVNETISILQKFKGLKSLKLNNNDGYNFYLLSCLLNNHLVNLNHLDITNCIEFTIDEINELAKNKKGLEIRHSAKIRNQTFDAIAEYLRELTRLPRL